MNSFLAIRSSTCYLSISQFHFRIDSFINHLEFVSGSLKLTFRVGNQSSLVTLSLSSRRWIIHFLDAKEAIVVPTIQPMRAEVS
jgi:hypothetical protein